MNETIVPIMGVSCIRTALQRPRVRPAFKRGPFFRRYGHDAPYGTRVYTIGEACVADCMATFYRVNGGIRVDAPLAQIRLSDSGFHEPT